MSEALTKTITIPADLVPCILRKADELNKRAKRLGCQPIRISLSDARSERADGGWNDTVRMTISGHAVCVSGWRFNGKVVHGEVANVVLAFDETDDLARFCLGDQRCDHCNTIRKRQNTYLLRNVDTGEIKQVGSSCLEDFFPKGYQYLIQMAESTLAFVSQAEGREEGSGEPRPRVAMGLAEFLVRVLETEREHGWVSRHRAAELEQETTASRAWRSEPIDLAKVAPETHAKVEEVLNWARAIDLTDPNADLHRVANPGALAKNGYVTEETIHVAAAMPKVYRMAKDGDLRGSNFVGSPGERIRLRVKLDFAKRYKHECRDYWVYRFVDRNHNVLLRRTVKEIPDLKPRRPFILEAEVKDHISYKGEKQTLVYRCSFEPL